MRNEASAANTASDSNAAPSAPTNLARETLEQARTRILAAPMSYPPFKRHEAAFRGNVIVRILRCKFSKSESGKDQILVEGVVVRTKKIDLPPSQYPANNPEGWDAFGFTEQEVERRPKQAVCSAVVRPGQAVVSDGNEFRPAREGEKASGVAARYYDVGEHWAQDFDDAALNVPLLDGEGQPQIGRHFAPLGPMDVTGYRFTYGDELTANPDGSYFWRTERLVNNVTFLGWRPERVNKAKGLNGGVVLDAKGNAVDFSFGDFVPEDGKDWVAAEDLGMTGEFGAYFEKEEVKEDSKFAPRLMLVSFKLLDTRVTKTEAVATGSKFAGLLKATRGGDKYDGRKVEAAKERAADRGAGQGARRADRTAADRADAGRVAGAPAEFCGKPCGRDKDPCMEKPGHDVGMNKTPCKPAPF